VPIPKHFRFVWRGVFSGTPETWAFGCHFGSNLSGGPDAHLGDVDMEGLVTAWTGLAAGGARLPDNAQLTDVRAYEIGTDGRSIGNVKLVDTSTRALSGGTAAKYPPQIALVATLVAPDRGPGKFGRMYLPTAATLSFSDCRMSESDAVSAAGSVSTFLKAVSDAVDIPATIQSAVGVNVSTRGGPDGTLQVIDHVEIGRVLDTLRTRRRALLEERVVDAHIDW